MQGPKNKICKIYFRI